jgi:hypothetical protein
MTNRTALSIVIACTALGCGGDDSGGQTPNGATLPAFGGGPQPGGGAPANGGGQGNPAASPNGQVNEGNGTPGLVTPTPTGTSGGTPTTPPTPTTPDPTVPDPTVPAPVGTPTMLDVTIEAETLNQTASRGFVVEGGGTTVGGIEVASVICFDNVDMTGIQSIDINYARNQPDVSFFGRLAVLWGSNDVATAMNLGEKLTTNTGSWTVFQPINVGLATQVSGVGQLCFRGLQGNGILNIDNFTLRGTPGTNDGVTNFNIPAPTGPAVALPQVNGNKVEFGGPGTSVAGVSLFWSNGRYGNDLFYNAEAVKWLKDDWGAQIVRAAMAVNDQTTPAGGLGGYLEAPFDNKFNVQKVVNAAIENGMYAIIDYHAHNAQATTAQAVQFFREMATFYGNFNNVIYEIYNEPVNTSWDQIKAYAQPVVAAIRAVDPNNLIIVGTPTFSSDLAAVTGDNNNPFRTDPNIAYTLHFYAGEGAHNQYQTRITNAMNAGIAVFVTEWGTTGANGLTAPNMPSTNAWMTFLRDNNVSHCNWALADQGENTASQLLRGGSPTGGWTDAQLTASGRLVKGHISGWPRLPSGL